MPLRSAGTVAGLEPGAAVAHEDLRALGARLGVDGHRAAAVSRRVDHRLARGGDERARALVERAVADGDDVDARAVLLLDLGGGLLERGAQVARLALRAVEQPAAQLALLAAGELRDRRAGRRRASARARASAGRCRAGARRPRRAPASGCARRAPR